MENRIWTVIGFWAMGLLLFIATFIIIRWAVDFATWGKLSAADTGTWVGAVGTVATLIGTIHLARTETRRRERNERTIARLHGASLVSKIENALVTTHEAAVMLHLARAGDREPAWFGLCGATLESIEFWSIDDITPLAPLPFNTAIKLAEAVGIVRSVEQSLKNLASVRIIPQQEQRSRVEMFTTLLKRAIEYLGDAARECRLGAVEMQLNND